jgi:peptidoglycan/LPS O-acetylase OafA/YrhL
MHPGLSLYLDLVRLLAAFEVFVFHMGTFPLLAVGRQVWNAYGHEAVTIFFVLSGFVIRHAVNKPGVTLEDFTVNRISRVYSVAIPCLLLTLLFDWLGRPALPELYKGLIPSGPPWQLAALGAAMLNENWGSTLMISNIPYWSISYEFWYYWIFAALFFATGGARWLFAALFMLIAGPNILLMAPIWAMGWWAYRWRPDLPLRSWLAWLLFLQPLAVFGAYAYFDWIMWTRQLMVPLIGFREWHVGLGFSRFFISDMLLGLSVTGHLLGARTLAPLLLVLLRRIGPVVRVLAGYSFTLYLLHQPAMLVIGAFIVPDVAPAARGWVVGAGTLLIVWGVSFVTETQRDRLKSPVRAVFRAVERLLRRWPGLRQT